MAELTADDVEPDAGRERELRARVPRAVERDHWDSGVPREPLDPGTFDIGAGHQSADAAVPPAPLKAAWTTPDGGSVEELPTGRSIARSIETAGSPCGVGSRCAPSGVVLLSRLVKSSVWVGQAEYVFPLLARTTARQVVRT